MGKDFLYRLKLGFVGKNQDLIRRHKSIESIHCFFDEGFVVEEIEKLFRPGIPTERPEPGSAAACEDKSKKFRR